MQQKLKITETTNKQKQNKPFRPISTLADMDLKVLFLIVFGFLDGFDKCLT